jgi:MerR family copper efflux transcriptional regulator
MRITVRAVPWYGVKCLTPYSGTGGIVAEVSAFTIGNLARTAGVSVETVRYYERRGLLERPVRRGSEYREYADADVERLRFIRRAKELGFTLGEIRDLLLAADTGCVDGVLVAARTKLAEIESYISEQLALRARLAHLVAVCADGSDDCVTLDIATG